MHRWFHPGFETDLIEAARYYQKQRPALGAEFLDEAEKAVETVMLAPERWPARHGGVRRFLVERFPYVIRYRISSRGDTVQFLSILHGARHPESGRERTGD
ncbi:MAG: type II toxin-antitoxin system RelE/ParE family toxin [Opitutae bacterium]|nr:type II toxin-antitoxin system RelE/ParE family toxin [Opitutae bacterium]